jgi:Protein of unknown function (DUF2892)
MKKNIGTADRLLRLGIAIILFILAWYYASWILLAVAVFTLFEAFAGWCIMFQFTGKNTCSHEIRKD